MALAGASRRIGLPPPRPCPHPCPCPHKRVASMGDRYGRGCGFWGGREKNLLPREPWRFKTTFPSAWDGMTFPGRW